MSSVGFVMLCHRDLDRATEVARHWAQRDCPVVIHIDARVPQADYAGMRAALAGWPNVRFSLRFSCEWGTWSIVRATQCAAEVMLRDFARVRHVFLASGACLPLRPVDELRGYLDARPQTDFIESVTAEDVKWTVGGLSTERFELRFPFSWKRQRRLFDLAVRAQQRLGVRRHVPDGIVPHLGSQWWCLTRATLSAILTDAQRRDFEHFFRHVWIPDESYFQTLARRHSKALDSRSLTLSVFDFQGKPNVFHDDHLALLRGSQCFVARKAWPRAERLYETFLSDTPSPDPAGDPTPAKVIRVFAKAQERRTRGRAGLYMQGRFPNPDWENGKTAAPYSVFHGFTDVFDDFPGWLSRRAGARVHGHLFHPDGAQFADGAKLVAGCLTADAGLRDYAPTQFLTNLIWNTRGERLMFQFGPGDRQDIVDFIASDPNAAVSVVTGAWAVGLYRSSRPFAELRSEAAQLQAAETEFVARLTSVRTKARVRIWTLAEFCARPVEHMQGILDQIEGIAAPRLTEAPRMVELSTFPDFVAMLRNEGMNPVLVGDFHPVRPSEGEAEAQTPRVRPYVVR